MKQIILLGHEKDENTELCNVLPDELGALVSPTKQEFLHYLAGSRAL